MFTEKDLDQIRNKGLDIATVKRQIDHFILGFPYIRLLKPAVPGDGILRFTPEEASVFSRLFENRSGMTISKFVPASGAASRMFKHLFEYLEKVQNTRDAAGSSGDTGSVAALLARLPETAFYPDLQEVMSRQGLSAEQMKDKNNHPAVVEAILSEQGLNYARLPKALLKFHRYSDGSRTALEEHLVEAATYSTDQQGVARIHLTISPEHREKFEELLDRVKGRYESDHGVTFDISMSVQKPSTDIIAVDEWNQPFRNADGSLLFRPGGHGALLENLNDVKADLIFIKNIDNLVPDRLKAATYEYKRLLGGFLIYLKDTIAGHLRELLQGDITPEETDGILHFATSVLCLDLPADFPRLSPGEQQRRLFSLLNRPVRVCGMVKNEGEPGGGPFWVADQDGRRSLQIVESSQINPDDPAQKEIASRATHFNPVDLVCSTRSFDGSYFDLREFVDPATGFISVKSSGGKTLKAQELPGLWNGSMARWITLFVEVPIITFNPVKTVNDLLRNEHLPSQP